MFFLAPLMLASIIGGIVLALSLLLKKHGKILIAKFMSYVGILIGVGFIWYAREVAIGWDGAGYFLIGFFVILECFTITLYLFFSKKRISPP
ncbi:hypothetical protein [Pradoshia sp.]